MNPVKQYLSTIGARGGKATSAAKKKAARKNGKKGGRPNVQELAQTGRRETLTKEETTK